MVGVEVRLSRPRAQFSQNQAITLAYAVRNSLPTEVFVFTEPLYIEPRGTSALHVVLGEMPIPDDVYFFEYEVPAQARLAAGAVKRRTIQIGMPHHRTIPRAGSLVDVVAPLRGVVTVYLTVGYTLHRFTPRTGDPWAELVREQALTPAATTTVRIA